MIYKASKDMTVTILTIGVIILFLLLSYVSIKGILNAKGDITLILVHSGVLLLLFGTIGGCYAFAPKGYKLDENRIIIVRPISNKTIELKNIEEIRLVDKKELSGMIRTFGVGGLFGNFGKFYCKAFGSLTLYCTQNKNYVLIKTAKKKILISPDDIALVDDIKKNISTDNK